MSKLLKSLQTKDALTANGAVTNSTSLNNCVDMFFLAGAYKNFIPYWYKNSAEEHIQHF